MSARRASRGDGEAPHGGEEDRDVDMFGRNFSSAGSALQGLLRKLGAGFEDMLPMGMSGTRIKGIIAGLRQTDDETAQLSALTELCELLSISTEESLAAFPVESFVPILVQLLNMDHNADMMLFAARALTFMADVLPASCGAIVRHGAVPAFCARLLAIEYIDLAEQSLQALEKLSHEHSQALLAAGGLLAVLSFLDFFPTGVQRVAVKTAANMCAGLGPAHAAAVRDAVPILANLLQYPDAKVVDSACVALTHVAEAFASDAALLDLLNSSGLIGQAVQLVSISDGGGMTAQLSVATYYALLKLLGTCASGSHAIAETLLQAGLSDILRKLLANSAMLAGAGGVQGPQLLRSVDQLYEVVALAHELLPALPDASVAMMAVADADAGVPSPPACERSRYLEQHPEVMLKFGQDLLPLLLQVYGSTVMPQVRHRCLAALVRMLHFSTPEMLGALLADVPISSFVASLLGARDARCAAYGMHMAEILMERLPDVFATAFVREGVVHAIGQLAGAASPAGAADGAAAEAAPKAAEPPQASAPPGRVTRARSAQLHSDPAATASPATGTATMLSALAAMGAPVARGAGSSRDGAAAAPPAPRTLSRMPSVSLREAVAARARRFKATYFAASDGTGALETVELQRLRELCEQLPSDPASLQGLFELLESSNVSVFELISSGAVAKLTAYLQAADLAPGAPNRDEQVLRRLHACVQVALAPGSGSSPAMLALVQKLQAALASTEAFPVLCSRLSAVPSTGAGGRPALSRSGSAAGSFGGPSSLSSGLAALAQPFKLRLVRHPAERTLKEYPSNIVLIEPLATTGAIEDFLWPRVSRGPSGGGAAAAATAAAPDADRSRSATPADTTAAAHNANAAASAAAGSANACGPGSTEAVVYPPMGPRSGGGGGGSKSTSPACAGGGGAPPAASGGRTAGAAGSSAPAAAPSGVPGAAAAAASKAQPIPDDGSGRRMTRAAAARALAEAQARLAQAQARAEEAVARQRRAGGLSDGDSDGGGDTLMGLDTEEQEHDDGGEDEDEDDMDGAGEDGIFDDSQPGDDDMEEDDDMGMGSVSVHDLHLTEHPGAARTPGDAAAAAGAAPAGGAAAPQPRSSQPAAAAAAAAPRPSAAQAAQAAAQAAMQAAAPAAAAGVHPPGGGLGGRPAAAVVAAAAAAPKLVFYLDDQPLPSGTTVFQAIQHKHLAGSRDSFEEEHDDGGGGGGGRGRDRRLWDEIYTMCYRNAAEAGADAAADDAAGPGGAQASQQPAGGGRPPSGRGARGRGGGLVAALAGANCWRSTPLGELLAMGVLEEVAAPESCKEILRLLRLLEAVSRLAPRLELCLGPAAQATGAAAAARPRARSGDKGYSGQALPLGRVPRDEFASTKLGSKLGQQLKDVLSICGGGLPGWCRALVFDCRFLFPFEVRRRYFYSTAFGLGRALQHMQAQNSAEGLGREALDRDGRELRIGRLQRQKVRVSRKRILESAHKVMELYARNRTVLELEYFGEVGTGLGPTLEFYTLLSHELQKRALGLWRTEDAGGGAPGGAPDKPAPTAVDGGAAAAPPPPPPPRGSAARRGSGAAAAAAGVAGLHERPRGVSASQLAREAPNHEAASSASAHDSHNHASAAPPPPPPPPPPTAVADYVHAPYGLFPAPLPEARRAPGARVVDHFRLLGRTVAKALQDSRLLDLPLSYVFYRVALGRQVDLHDVAALDPALGSSLERLHRALRAHRAAEAKGTGAGGRRPLLVDGVPLEDLCLTFTLPGYPEYELRPGGSDTLVDASNLEAYIAAVVDATLGSGVRAQMDAFREGFNEVFPLSLLAMFYEDELEALLCGAPENWSVAQLSDAIKFDHGYTPASTPVRHLLEVLCELEPDDQRRFLRFVTGCPRLPPGGVAALQPRLTVVRKHPSLAPADGGGGGGGGVAGSTPGSTGGDWSEGTPLADGDLPSVMTCANYIKLPPYSSKSVMRDRLLYAIREGQGSFDLS